jgi:hypothetical protein
LNVHDIQIKRTSNVFNFHSLCNDSWADVFYMYNVFDIFE